MSHTHTPEPPSTTTSHPTMTTMDGHTRTMNPPSLPIYPHLLLSMLSSQTIVTIWRRCLHYQEYIPHLQAITQSSKPTAACYRKLWTGTCTKPRCRWEHDTKALQESWHYHQDLLANSPFQSTHRYSSANPPKILPRPAPMHPTPHQDYHRPSRHTSDPHHASRYPHHR